MTGEETTGGAFAADWLALREAADARARDTGLARRLAAHLADGTSLRIVDLGAGAGNNLRAVAPLLPAGQRWTLVDHDPALLAEAAAHPPAGATVETHAADLADPGLLRDLLAPGADLVTCSALLDLAGAVWLDRLAAEAARAGAAVLAVLSYDGHETWEPAHPLDRAVLDAFHADQHRDKGLGPALGPGAHDHLARALGAAGCDVAEAASPWVLEAPRDAALIAALADGIGGAVASRVEGAEAWAKARRTAARVTIGHRDLLALPRP